MADPRSYHIRLPRWAGPRLPEPPVAWYPGARQHARQCSSERTARGDGRIRAVVIHATAGASSAGAMSVMARHTASWHWLVPDENEAEHGRHVWACTPESRAAWHVRNDRSHPDVQGGARYANYWTLGVELVNTQVGDPFSAWQVEQAAALVRYAWSRYPHLVDVVSHARLDPARRSDPGAHFPWERFRELVLAPLPDGPVTVAREGEAPARATVPAALREPPVRLVGPDGRPIDVDARILDGVTVVEARPLVEALGFGVAYADGARPTMHVVAGAAREREAVAAPDDGPYAPGRALAAAPRDADTDADTGLCRAPRRRAARGRRARTFDAIPDALDFRDVMFVPTLVEVPLRRPLATYRRAKVPVLDQRGEGACTGFGLATVANYLLRVRRHTPSVERVSPRMLYEMAKRYDEWPGERYEGSSARGAVKGWHKHGVCGERDWPYDFGAVDRELTPERAADAVRRPLGAYFRVNHRDLVAMHAAIAEAGVLFATATVHAGWETVRRDGVIHHDTEPLGGHAFAIVGYEERGFWIQNSWGDDWGHQGFALVSYDDWLANGTDVWVARLGAPVALGTARATARAFPAAAGASRAYVFEELRPHVVSLGNDGALRTSGTYGTSRRDVERIVREDLPRLTAGWRTDRPRQVLLYAHGGLVGEDAALQRVAEYRAALLKEEVFPISFVWRTDFWTTVANVLHDAARRRRPEGALDAAKDFMLERLDDMLEPVARAFTGRASWKELQENALLAARRPTGGAAVVAGLLAELHRAERARTGQGLALHLVAHSAGSILLAPLVQLLTGQGADEYGLTLETVTLWAPACTVRLFEQSYRPAIDAGRIGRFALYTLTDEAEREDHCANTYHKSLLYLVSNALEERPRLPFRDGTPILGMERFVRAEPGLEVLLRSGPCEWVLSPNTASGDSLLASTARHHGDFDDDPATVRSTLARVLGRRGGESVPPLQMQRTAAGQRDIRAGLTTTDGER